MENYEQPLADQEGGTNVSEQYQDYIKSNIIACYKRKIIVPLIYFVFIVALTFISPVFSLINPASFNSQDVIKDQYRSNRYVRAELKNLYFTGYTKEWASATQGYYYYTMIGDDCVIILLSPVTCEQGKPIIESLSVKGKINKNGHTEKELLSKLAKDLSWDESGINSTISSYNISEPAATGFLTWLLILLVLISGVVSLAYVITYAIYIVKPTLSAPVTRLRAYGNSKLLLAQAEEELATLPQLATEDMYITEHFFIELSKYGIAIVPINEITWIYKYSTLHKFLWHHFKISYTLHITANKRLYIKCPKNEKSDIDGVIEYLAEANHNILVGFSEENRVIVEKQQGEFIPVRKFLSYLSRRK